MNRQIWLEDINLVETLAFQTLDPRYIRVQLQLMLYGYGLLMAVGLLPLLTDWEGREWTVIALESALGVALFANLLMLRAICRFKGYALRDLDISYRSGIIFPSVVTVPFCKIQLVSVKQNIMERVVGLYSLEIVNGSQNLLKQISIPGLTQPQAEQLKDFLISKSAHGSN